MKGHHLIFVFWNIKVLTLLKKRQGLSFLLKTTFRLQLTFSLFLTSCHIISPPDLLGIESELGSSHSEQVHELNETELWYDRLKTCQLGQGTNSNNNRLAFIDWWEGQWSIDSASLSNQLALAMNSENKKDPNILTISKSLSAAFHLTLKAQQATLKINGDIHRLAISPLKRNRGIRLVGGGRELLMWCEGDKAYWRTESGESFPLIAISNR